MTLGMLLHYWHLHEYEALVNAFRESGGMHGLNNTSDIWIDVARQS